MRLTNHPELERGLSDEMAGEGAYILVDRALYQELQFRPLLGIEAAVLPVPGVKEPKAQAYMPVLLTWPEEPELQRWLLPRSLRWARENYAATWLRSVLGAEALAEHLGLCMASELDDGRRILLRFADARTLPAIAEHLTAPQRAALFAPVARWWYLDRQEQVRELALPEGEAADTATPPLVLSERQLAALMEAAEPDVVLQLLAQMSPEALAAMERAERHRFAVQSIEAARAWGIDASFDLANFTSRVLEYGAECHETAEWQALVDKVHAGGLTWTEAMNIAPKTAGGAKSDSSGTPATLVDNEGRLP